MRVLVTGGAGFVGSTTSAALIDAGHDVLVLDDLSHGHRDAIPAGADFVHGDTGDPDIVADVVSATRFDACVHFAARIDAGESMVHPERYFSTNTAGTALLIEQLIKHDVTRFVLSSTAAVYGETEVTPIDEHAPTGPSSPYGESKLLAEQMLAWHQRLHGFAACALRYFNAAGATAGRPERHHPETHLIPNVLAVAAGERDHVTIHGDDYDTPDGTAVRDYVHVADLASAHVRALEEIDASRMKIWNLGTGIGHSVRSVVDVAREVTGATIPTVTGPRRPGDPPVLVAAADRARRELGWNPTRVTLLEIVTDAWRYRTVESEAS